MTPPDFPDANSLPAASTIDQVLAALRAIEASLVPRDALPRDGVAWFNRLYLTTTEAVADAVESSEFEHPEAVSRLDVVFANLYFDAVRLYAEAPASAPRAWRPLLAARGRRDVAPLQFALAGMNAHVNRDLPAALFAWWRESAVPRERLQADFTRVDRILARVQDETKEAFLHGAWRVLDTAFGRVDDVVAGFSIAEARKAAWTQGEVLTTLGGPERPLGRAYLDSLDGVVGFAGRGLLVPTATGT
jgi:hypothetical protein